MHRFANPAQFLNLARPLTGWLLWLGTVTLLFGAVCGLVLTPADYLQGDSVRILYVHVPAAWLGLAGWSGIALAALMQLVWKHPLAAIAGRAIAVPGALFTAICLITGSLWGRPTWGTYWQWDGRMTSMLILFFLYLGYIALAASSAKQGQAGSSPVTAIFGLVGAINIPIINRSVVWWNSLHQGPSITLKGSSIEGSILWPLGFTLIGFSLIFSAIILMRIRSILARNKIEARLLRLARG